MLDFIYGGVVGEIGSDRNHRDVAVGKRIFVGLLIRVGADEFACHPPIGSADGICAFFKTVDPGGMSLMADMNAFDLVGREPRDIDVEGSALWQGLFQCFGYDVAHGWSAGREIGFWAVAENGESNSGESVEAGFEDGTHGATIKDVDRGIASVIDARKD